GRKRSRAWSTPSTTARPAWLPPRCSIAPPPHSPTPSSTASRRSSRAPARRAAEMMPVIALPAFVIAAAKAALVLGFAFGVTGLLRRASAASRHVVWLAAFVGVLALPVGALLVPSWSVSMPFRFDGGPTPVVPELALERDKLARDVEVNAARLAEADRLAKKVRVTGLGEAHATLAEREAALSDANARLRAAVAIAKFEPRVANVQATAWPWSTRIFMLWIAGF